MTKRDRPVYSNDYDNEIIGDLDRAWQAIEELRAAVLGKLPISARDACAACEAQTSDGGCERCMAKPVKTLTDRSDGVMGFRPMTPEERERDILIKAEAVEALRTIRKNWKAIQETGGLDYLEIRSGRQDAAGWNPRLGFPVAYKLEVPLRHLAAEWMARFVTAAEALCLDVIERGAVAIPKGEQEKGR